MPIEFYCSSCQSKLRTPDSSIGKGARCPNCGNIEIVPESSAPDQPPQEEHEFPAQGDFGSAKPQSGYPISSLPQHVSPNPYAAPHQEPNRNVGQPVPGYVPRVDAYTAKSKLLAPGILLAIFNSLGLLFCLFGLLGFLMELADNQLKDDDIGGIIVIGVGMITTVLGLFGAICMLRMKGYAMAVVGSITSILSGLTCCLLPMGFGIWALVILMDADVKRFFR